MAANTLTDTATSHRPHESATREAFVIPPALAPLLHDEGARRSSVRLRREGRASLNALRSDKAKADRCADL